VSTYYHRQLDALGDPTRRAIFERLADGPRRVGELARDFPVSRPAVSQHLRVLKEAGLVMDRPDGQGRLYQLNPDGIGALRAHFEEFWNQALVAFQEAAEHTTEKDARRVRRRRDHKAKHTKGQGI
jgi:DNA-binding transcriptional ArsR family regulator